MDNIETVFNTEWVHDFCNRCSNNRVWASWEYEEPYSPCEYEGDELCCPHVVAEFFDRDE